jgi:methionine aminopeptidase
MEKVKEAELIEQMRKEGKSAKEIRAAVGHWVAPDQSVEAIQARIRGLIKMNRNGI